MPLYEYQCDACGHRFELIQKFSDSPVEKCPLCGGAVRKLISSPAIQFKGSGWYITDYARKSDSSGTPDSGAGASETPAAGSEASGSSKDAPKEPVKGTPKEAAPEKDATKKAKPATEKTTPGSKT